MPPFSRLSLDRFPSSLLLWQLASVTFSTLFSLQPRRYALRLSDVSRTTAETALNAMKLTAHVCEVWAFQES